MTDENTPNSKAFHPDETPGSDSKKGQMLVIYLPEGSVIVDRTEMSNPPVYEPVVERSVPAPAVVSAPEVAPTAAVIPTPDLVQPPHQVTLEEIVHLVVEEMLRTSKDSGLLNQPAEKKIAPIVVQPQLKSELAEEVTSLSQPKLTPRRVAAPAVPAQVSRMHFRKRRQLNWVHGVNTLFVAFVVVVSLIPAILSSVYGVGIYASKTPHSRATIATGDLIVSRALPASDLKVNDVILVRDANTWHLDVREVTASTSASGTTTLATTTTGGTATEKTDTMLAGTEAFRVSTIIPKLGYIPMFFASTFVKVLGGFFILILNLIVHYRRSRRRVRQAFAQQI